MKFDFFTNNSGFSLLQTIMMTSASSALILGMMNTSSVQNKIFKNMDLKQDFERKIEKIEIFLSNEENCLKNINQLNETLIKPAQFQDVSISDLIDHDIGEYPKLLDYTYSSFRPLTPNSDVGMVNVIFNFQMNPKDTNFRLNRGIDLLVKKRTIVSPGQNPYISCSTQGLMDDFGPWETDTGNKLVQVKDISTPKAKNIKIGIGTSSPQHILDVRGGNIKISDYIKATKLCLINDKTSGQKKCLAKLGQFCPNGQYPVGIDVDHSTHPGSIRCVSLPNCRATHGEQSYVVYDHLATNGFKCIARPSGMSKIASGTAIFWNDRSNGDLLPAGWTQCYSQERLILGAENPEVMSQLITHVPHTHTLNTAHRHNFTFSLKLITEPLMNDGGYPGHCGGLYENNKTHQHAFDLNWGWYTDPANMTLQTAGIDIPPYFKLYMICKQ